MIRATIIFALAVSSICGHAFSELLEGGFPPASYHTQSLPDHVPTPPEIAQCKYSFGWGRGTVTIINLLTQIRSECTFSHTIREQIPAASSSIRDAIFYQHYTCTDQTRAYYSTNWLGGSFFFRHEIVENQSVKCD